MISIFSFSSRSMSAFHWGRGGARQKLLPLMILCVLLSMQYGRAQAQSGWYHCDIQDFSYTGPGTRYFCRPVSYDWLCNIARITSFCNNPSDRGDKGGDSDDSRNGSGGSSGRSSSGGDSAGQASGAGLSANIRRLDAAGIGLQWIIDAGFIAAADIWGEDIPDEVCLDGLGSLLFLDASSSPRAESWLDSVQRDGQTCAEIDGPGTVVLMAEPASASETARQARQCRVTTTGHLKVRAGPSLDDDVIGYLRRGITLRLLSRSGDWIEIEYRGEAGWIGAGYTSEDCGESVSPAPATSRLPQCVATTGNLKVRAGPSLDEEVIGYLRRGTALRLLSWSEDWFEIEYQDKTGWIGAGYTSEDCSEAISPAPAASRLPQCVATTGNLKVRVGPSLDEEVIGYLRRGAALRLISRSGDWFEIGYRGKAGWIGAAYAREDCG